MRSGLILLLVIIFASSVSAAPSINGVTPVTSDGQTATISGSLFGSNPQVGEAAFLGGINGWAANQEAGTYLTGHTPFSTAPNTVWDYIYPGADLDGDGIPDGRGVEDQVSNLVQRVPGKNNIRIRTGADTPSGEYTSSFGLSTVDPNQDFFVSFWANINDDVSNYRLVQCDHPDAFGGTIDGDVCTPQLKFFSFSPYSSSGFYGSIRNQGIVITNWPPDSNMKPTLSGFHTEWDTFTPSPYEGTYNICGSNQNIYPFLVPYLYANAPNWNGCYNGQNIQPYFWALHAAGGTDSAQYMPDLREWFKVQIWVKGGEYDAWDGMYRFQQLANGQNVFTQDLRNMNMFTQLYGDSGDFTYPQRFWIYHFLGNSCDFYYGPTNDDGTPRDPSAFNYYPVAGECHGSTTGDWSTYVDDFFVQPGSIAHIEIGDAPLYEDCTNLEIQKPTTWNQDSISFEVNYGTFQQGQQVWLYVVDENGDMSSGYPITLGAAPTEATLFSVSGTLDDGASVSLNGALLGTHTNQVEWLGGINGALESMPLGSTLRKPYQGEVNDPAWDNYPGWQAERSTGESPNSDASFPVVSNEISHSGANSLRHYGGSQSGVGWKTGSQYLPSIDTIDSNMNDRFEKVFFSSWIYFNPLANDGTMNSQWKIMNVRLNYLQDDEEGEFFWESQWNMNNIVTEPPHYFAVDEDFRNIGCVYPCGSSITCTYCAYPQPINSQTEAEDYYFRYYDSYGNPGSPPLSVNKWMRIDWWLESSSDFDTWDGLWYVRVMVPETGDTWMWRLEDFASHASDHLGDTPPVGDIWDTSFDSVTWKNQIQWANALAKVFVDDQYIQFNSPARVELCNNADYYSATHCEIQRPISWADSNIQFETNFGSFSSGEQVYLFVITDDLFVTNPLLVTLGTGVAPLPTCFDGVQNQGESGVDCGGPCVAQCQQCTVGDPDQSCTTVASCPGTQSCVGGFWSSCVDVADDGCPVVPVPVFVGVTPADGASVSGDISVESQVSSAADLFSLTYSWDSFSFDFVDAILVSNFNNLPGIGDSSSVVQDITLNDNDGLLQTGASYTAGKFGSAVNLANNGAETVSFGDVNVLSTAGDDVVSASLWLYEPEEQAGGVQRYILAKNSEFFFGYDTNNELTIGTWGSNIDAVACFNPPTGEWNHVYFVWNEGTSSLKIYVNGVLSCQGTTTDVSSDLSSSLTLGSDNGAAPTEIFVDDLFVFDRELSLSEINLLYNSRFEKTSLSTYELSVLERGVDSSLHTFNLTASNSLGGSNAITRSINSGSCSYVGYDITGECNFVGWDDFLIVVENFRTNNLRYDFNNDNTVNILDLVLHLLNWD